jgi:release factor glutamine methyltransferase
VNRRGALGQARDILAKNGIEEASLESEILLRHALGINRAQLYADLDIELSPKQEKSFGRLFERRQRGEPAAYITGHREFYGLDFKVNRHVLIPRPETELLVELAIDICRTHPNIATVADIGTGCGNIAVSLSVNLRNVKIRAIDISGEALSVAVINAAANKVKSRVSFLQGNLLEPLQKPVDLIAANLPYVKTADLPRNDFEPRAARDGGKDGLDAIKNLCLQAEKRLKRGGFLLLEIGEGQAAAVKALLQKTFPGAATDVHKDLAGIERVIKVNNQ